VDGEASNGPQGPVPRATPAGEPEEQKGVMKVHVGDRLVVGGDTRRTGIVIGVPHEDGSPPYIVKWLANGNIAMVLPDQYTVVIPAGHPAGTDCWPGR
jgi:hypothetical protein